MKTEAKESCPSCRGADLGVFFEQNDVPVFCNVLHGSRESAESVPRGDIRLGFCAACGMISNVAFDPEQVRYAEGYENSLHCSRRFQAFAEQLAERLVDQYGLRGVEILEIGAGRGEFLAILCEKGGNRGTGFDPSVSAAEQRASGRPFRLVTRDFRETDAGDETGLICSRHVLEHVDDPRGFVSTLARAARKAPRAAFYVEVPNALWTLRDLGIWDIIYEHCSYFVPWSLKTLLLDRGFVDPCIMESFDGQFLSAEGPANQTTGPVDSTGPKELSALVRAFARRRQECVAHWNQVLSQCLERRQSIAVWGAGSKGVTFLNSVAPIDSISLVIDINPRKHGKYVAGTGHRVVPPESLRRQRVDRVFVMNPGYLDEVRSMLWEQGYRGQALAVSGAPPAANVQPRSARAQTDSTTAE